MTEEFDYEGTLAEVKKIQQSNIDKINALGALGKMLDPGAAANIKIDTFIEMFLDRNAKVAYVLRMEQGVQEELDKALMQVRQEVITKKPGLIIPG